jgi:hypothetical protein
MIDRDLFPDLLTYIFEDLVGTGAEELAVVVTTDPAHAIVTITGTGGKNTKESAGTVRGFLSGLSARAGGPLSGEIVPEGRRYTMRVNLAA